MKEITFDQLMLIKQIEDCSNYEFKGKTKKQASDFINNHMDVLYGGDEDGEGYHDIEDALRERYNGGGS